MFAARGNLIFREQSRAILQHHPTTVVIFRQATAPRQYDIKNTLSADHLPGERMAPSPTTSAWVTGTQGIGMAWRWVEHQTQF
jgi:hypothetical protein